MSDIIRNVFYGHFDDGDDGYGDCDCDGGDDDQNGDCSAPVPDCHQQRGRCRQFLGKLTWSASSLCLNGDDDHG